MIISLSGVQGSGKTTTLNLLKEQPIFEGYKYVTEIMRTLKSEGFKINEAGDGETQLAVVSMHLSNLLYAHQTNVVVDRGLLDVFAYTRYAYEEKKISESIYLLVKKLFELHAPRYDQIFLFEPHGRPLENNGVRSMDMEWHDRIDSYFHEAAATLSNVTILGKGTADDRVETIVEWLIDHGSSI